MHVREAEQTDARLRVQHIHMHQKQLDIIYRWSFIIHLGGGAQKVTIIWLPSNQ